MIGIGIALGAILAAAVCGVFTWVWFNTPAAMEWLERMRSGR